MKYCIITENDKTPLITLFQAKTQLDSIKRFCEMEGKPFTSYIEDETGKKIDITL